MTKEEFLKLVPNNPTKADLYYQPIKDTMSKFNINSPLRQSHFIAQLLHETGGLQNVKEQGNESYFKKYDIRYNPSKAKELGNLSPGDGFKYRGRGLFQLTGKANYKAFGDYVGKDLVSNPDLVATDPSLNALVAGWFWNRRSLNDKADNDDIVGITKRINGGTTGLPDRINRLNTAKSIIKKEPLVIDLGFMQLQF